MEKKSSVKEVHKIIQQDYPELYKKISAKLGNENPFAKFNIGAGTYIWSDNRCEWHQMIAWSSLKQETVRAALASVRVKLNALYGEKQTDLLLTVPDDGYIYFNDDEGEVKILITGWGFKKPVRVEGKPVVEEIVGKNAVTLAFVYDGKRLPDYPFGIRLLNKARKLHTGADGLCQMGNLCVGEKYTLYDLQDDNKAYNLEIVAGKSHYDIDLTRPATLLLSAKADGQPVTNEQVDIQYHGAAYNAVTDAGGNASVELPWYDNEPLTAKLRNQSKSINIQLGQNHIDFEFTTPVTEPEAVETDILVSVLFDSAVCPGKNVVIEYNGQTNTGTTDENGQYACHVQIADDEVCKVSVDGYTPQQRALEKIPTNEFRFEKTTPVSEPGKLQPILVVKRENGDIVSGYPVTVKVIETEKRYITDREGKIVLPEMPLEEVMVAIDGMDSSHTEEYTVTPEQEEYVFTIPDEEPDPEPQLKIMFRDKEDKPFAGKNVTFHQEGREDLTVYLDENGDTYLPQDTFCTDKKITAAIRGWEEDYDPIQFETREDEYEYLLHEMPAEHSWWMIALQILAVVAAIVVAVLLWPIISGACAGAFDGLYS